MKRITFSIILSILVSTSVNGQTDQDLIKETIYDFIDGTTYNYPDTIASAFLPGTRMFLYNDEDSLWMMTSEQYASLYSRKPPGTRNNRIGSIKTIDIEKDVAFAKVQFIIPFFGNRYYDLLLLKKIQGQWKIIAKCTSAEPIPKSPQEMIAQPVKEVVMDNLNRPWSMAFLSEEEAIIAEKDGDLLRVNLSTKEKQKITGLPTDVARKIKIDTSKHSWGVFPPRAHGQTRSFNAGWFQVLLDPDFKNNAYIYISYAAENKKRESTTKVIRGKLSGNKLTRIETLFLAEPYSHGLFHYGGGMIFGSDGKLYITIGERNLFEHLNPVPPLSQDITDKRGKIIRINPDGSIPDDNPYFGPDAIKGLFALGIRASQGLTIDPATDKIWFSEHGTIQGDELNILTAGANYGWPHRTSGGYRSKDYNPPIIPGTTFTDPVHFWDKTVAPTGLTFYSGREFPQWNGNLLVPGLSKGSLWRVIIANDTVISAEELFINDRVRLRKAVVSPRGQLYLLSDEEHGKLIRVRNVNN
ncbi:PQQ-dependent sugar dehydrogenase [Fulvivirgaceae bacterium BMA10]|uniref:PQQ-dependent sugar dehydrogenase n=1 Tax=Splendidivirga corallicola TaxID=3051826 RepID=A0ABT8KKB2_9BACT|nr:PQQ-dependent sugar dehydrogenase [Fulvivirgaceae bacterium BMA10]